jgi:hypothetical protein
MATREEGSEHSHHRTVTMPPKKAKDLPDHHEGDCHGEEDEQGTQNTGIPSPAHGILLLTPQGPLLNDSVF